MTNPNVTIRHARQALKLLVRGATSEFPELRSDDPRVSGNVVDLIDALTEELGDFDMPGTEIKRLTDMIGHMQAMLANQDCPTIVRELLTQYDLNP